MPAFAVATAVFLLFLSQCEIELALLNVGTCHLDFYRVAQLIFVVMTAANETIVALIEVVVVVVQVVHGHHAFAVVLVYLAVNAVRRYAADVGRLFVAYLVGHKLHHLIFYRVALGVLCYLLHVARVFAQLLIILLVGTASTVLIAC